MPSITGITARDKAMRELFFYFFRIFGLFLAVWVPVYVIEIVFYWEPVSTIAYSRCWGPAINSIGSTLFIMTKSDARRYIIDFVTLACLRTKEQVQEAGTPDTENPAAKSSQVAASSPKAATMTTVPLENEKSGDIP